MLLLIIVILIVIIILILKKVLDKYDLDDNDENIENTFENSIEENKSYDQTDWFENHIDPYTGDYNGYSDVAEEEYNDD